MRPRITMDDRTGTVHRPRMAKIGERASLKILREKSFGLYLDGGELGEILLPHREVPKDNVIGGFLSVFIYTDSEDRPVATLKTPKAMPGEFAKLKCVAVTGVGAFLDWGLAKELLVPFREQKARMEPGKTYLVHVHVDAGFRPHHRLHPARPAISTSRRTTSSAARRWI